MPISASTPRMATKPSGAPLGSSAATTPIKGQRRHRGDEEQREKLCSCSIRIVAMTNSISGTTA
jgi:hypothetical protein